MKVKNFLTPKRFEQYTCWAPTLGAYTATAFAALVYFTDWRVIVTKIPIYNRKFQK